MMGTIGVVSAPGKGSTFWFNVSLVPVDAQVSEKDANAGVDWKQVDEVSRYLSTLLAEGNQQARVLWNKNSTLFEALLRERMVAFEEAIETFDFEMALQILSEARMEVLEPESFPGGTCFWSI